MLIKFKKPDPRAGQTVRMDSSRGRHFVGIGSADQVGEQPAGDQQQPKQTEQPQQLEQPEQPEQPQQPEQPEQSQQPEQPEQPKQSGAAVGKKPLKPRAGS